MLNAVVSEIESARHFGAGIKDVLAREVLASVYVRGLTDISAAQRFQLSGIVHESAGIEISYPELYRRTFGEALDA
jgi:hypothetical protein